MPSPATEHIPTADELRTARPGQSLRDQCDAIRGAIDAHHWAAVNASVPQTFTGGVSRSAADGRAFQAHQQHQGELEGLLHQLSSTPEAAREVDWSQVRCSGDQAYPRAAGARSRVLGPEQRVAAWVAERGEVREEQADLSLGAMLRGWLTSQWDGAEAEQRALLEGTQAGGGVLVPTPLSAEIIDRARNMSRCFTAGARVVPMDSQTLTVPRISGSPTPAWREENALIPEGDLTFDSVKFTARSLALIVRASRELIEDGQDVDNTVRDDLAAQVALELDRVMLRGTGTAPEPRGVRNTTGVTVTSLGTDGATPDWDTLVDLVQAVRATNHEPTAAIHAPRTETTLSKLKDAQGQYLRPPAALDTLPRLATNQVPVDLTTGTSTDTSESYVGQWDRLWLGVRTELVLGTLVERYAEFGQIAFLVWVRADVQLAQPGAFAVATGVRP